MKKKRNFERLSVKIVIFLNKNHLCKQTQEWKQIQSDLENGSQEWFSSLWSSTYYHTCLPLVRSSFSHTSWTIGVVFLSSTVRLKTQTHADVILPAHTHHARLSGWNVTPELLSEVSRSKTPAIFLQLLQDTLCLGSVTESVAITSIQAYKFLASWILFSKHPNFQQTGHKPCLCLPLQSFCADILVRIDACLNCRANGNGA